MNFQVETENEALEFIEKNIETPIISISNNEEFQDADKYSSSVAKWVKVLLNSIASIYMKKA